MVLLGLGFRKRLEGRWLGAFLVLCGFNALTASFSGCVMAEPAFLLLSLLILRWRDEDALLVGVLVGVSMLVRPMGAALAAGLLIPLLRERRFKRALQIGGAAAAVAGAWALRNVAVAGSGAAGFTQVGEGLGMLGGGPGAWLANAAGNAFFYVVESASVLLPLPRFPGAAAAALILWPPLLWGAYQAALKERSSPEVWYTAAYTAMLLVWIHPDERYLVPLLPFLAYFFLKGLADFPWRPARRAGPAVAGLAALLVLASGLSLARSIGKPGRYNTPPVRTYGWLAANVPTDSTVLCSMAGRVHLYTGLRTEEFPMQDSPADFQAFLTSERVDYVLFSEDESVTSAGPNRWETARAQARAALTSGPAPRTVFSDPDEGTVVLEVRPRSMVPIERDRNPSSP